MSSLAKSNRYRHVFFDFDGVICDSLRLAIEVFNHVRTAHFPTLPKVLTRGDMTIVYAGSLRTCLHQWLSPSDARRFFDLHSDAMATRAVELLTFPGIGNLLNELDDRTASIVTSAYSKAIRSIISASSSFDPAHLFAISGRELRQKKSDKILQILDELRLDAAQALYVGDLESDIMYCREIQMDIVAVGYGYHPAEYLADKGADYLVGSVEGLATLLNQIVIPND